MRSKASECLLISRRPTRDHGSKTFIFRGILFVSPGESEFSWDRPGSTSRASARACRKPHAASPLGRWSPQGTPRLGRRAPRCTPQAWLGVGGEKTWMDALLLQWNRAFGSTKGVHCWLPVGGFLFRFGLRLLQNNFVLGQWLTQSGTNRGPGMPLFLVGKLEAKCVGHLGAG